MGDLVFAAIAPHGEMAIPEACRSQERELAVATQQGMLALGERFHAARPDAVVVLTPHGIHVEGAMAVVMASALAGELEDVANPIRLRCPVDRDLAAGVQRAMRQAAIPTVGVSFGGNVLSESSMPMDWGVLIPLWFMGGRQVPPLPAVVVSPARDLSPGMHVRAGRAIADAIRAGQRRVALIASADQGHGHRADGPYGFAAASAEFDRRVVKLVQAGDLAPLVDIPAQFVDQAKADSWWQMLMLHGALGRRWQAEFISYEAPTYFGMLCAAFTPPPVPSRLPIRTARLTLEPVEHRHDAALVEAIQSSRAELVPWMPWAVPPPTVLDHRRYSAEAMSHWAAGREFHWAMVEGGMAIGVVGMNVLADGDGEIHYWVRTDRMGRGLVTEAARSVLEFAFGVLRLEGVVLLAGVENLASLRIADKLGFTREGQSPDGMEGGLGHFDAYRHRLTAAAWRKHSLGA